ncbi:MAG TPA: type I pullulanase [Treponemataceae bacterium]|nr:type I pullulanase [Treponemataceae bacterium]
MKKRLLRTVFTSIALAAMLFSVSCSSNKGASSQGMVVEPGFWEDTGNPKTQDVLALEKQLDIQDDEFAIFYVRNDEKYDRWGLWIWAIKDGDGSKAWPFTQEWHVQDGIGYMRLKLDGSDTGGTKFVDSDGNIGLIVREKEGWTKDCPDDRIWIIDTNNKCIIFSGDQATYNCGEFKPRITSAVLATNTAIELTLSTSYGLSTTEGEDSGFNVTLSDGTELAIADSRNASRSRENNYARKVILQMADPVVLTGAIRVSHPTFEAVVTVDVSQFAWEEAEKTRPDDSVQLGCVYDAKADKADFVLWAPSSATAVLKLYKKDTDKTATKTFDMTKNKDTGVWTVSVKGEKIDGWFYTYELDNSRGVREVLDPYASSMAAYRNEGGSGRAAVVDMNSSKATPANWSKNYAKLTQREDAIIYEVSVRDFTISPDSGVRETPGTYKAFVEKMSYLKDLGVTHIQLLPVVNFYFTDETDQSYEDQGTSNNNNYNWGYDPHNYFSPEGWFASDPTDPYSRVKELRMLIQTAHDYGMGVLLDVVYNHVASTAVFEDVVPGYYFRMKNGKYLSNSGCGNDTASERKMMARLIVDSTKHWVENYNVDGFRFDLMGLMESTSVLDSYEACAAVNPDVLFIGEGWKMYNGVSGTVGLDQNYMTKTDDIAVFNDEIRDAVKAGGFNEAGQGFITGKPVSAKHVYANLCGTPELNYRADSPGDNVQYLVCHDGLTLHDSISNNVKLDGSDPTDRAEIVARAKIGNTIALTAQGIAFLHAGQERGRTKPKLHATGELVGNFVRNSYDSSDNINQIIWTLKPEYKELKDYTAGLITLRRSTHAFRLGDADLIAKKMSFYEEALDGTIFQLAFKIADVDGYDWIVAMNVNKESVVIDLGEDLTTAQVVVDAKTAGTTPIATPVNVSIQGTTVELGPLTTTIFKIKK